MMYHTLISNELPRQAADAIGRRVACRSGDIWYEVRDVVIYQKTNSDMVSYFWDAGTWWNQQIREAIWEELT